MTNFNYENTSKMIFGKNDESVLANEIKSLGGKNVLIHYGQNSIIKSGLLARVVKALENAGIKHLEYGGVQSNPLRSHALQGVELAKKNNVDFILAIGGGSVIDSAKCIAAGAVNENIWEYYADITKQINGALPLGVVLTIPAAGSECSTSTVIKDDRDGLKYNFSHDYVRSKFAFINPELMATLPKKQIAFGASDILSHLLERYFSPEQNVTVTDKLLTGAIQAMFEIAPKVYKDSSDYENMAEFCLLGTLAHNGMLALGRVIQSWESHRIETKLLSGAYGIAHGQGLAVIFPAWLKFAGKKKPAKILQFSKEVMLADGKNEQEIIENGIAKLEAYFQSFGLAVTLKELNIKVADAQKIAKGAFPKDIVLGGYGKLSIDEILNVIALAE